MSKIDEADARQTQPMLDGQEPLPNMRFSPPRSMMRRLGQAGNPDSSAREVIR